MLHGSQGCATYIRRYLISHYREPMDIASSNFSEETTIFGGNRNFNTGIDNIISQYHPKVIGIASTCLAETIGEDVNRLIYEYRTTKNPETEMFFASTPSYSGTHYEGFHQAVFAAVKAFAQVNAKTGRHVNLFCNFVSPEDIRHLKEITADFGIDATVFPDYSETLDSVSWDTYKRIPDGGTTLDALQRCGSALLSVELGNIIPVKQSAGEFLRDNFDVVLHRIGLPLGIRETDRFFALLTKISGMPMPQKYAKQRGRLVDLYIDGHKYVSGKRAAVFAEEDLAVALAAFLTEIGVKPVLIATGGESGKLKSTLQETLQDLWSDDYDVRQGLTFSQMEELLADLPIDLMVGNSKGYYIARKIDVPLVRVGFPIHDRIGAAHKLTLGYEGATRLFEETVNALLDDKQRKSTIAWKYM